jgi:hypothetical protein
MECFRCPADSELSPLARRFFPFPRFPVPKEPKVANYSISPAIIISSNDSSFFSIPKVRRDP